MFLDAFAGSGSYGNDGDERTDGSPVMIARIAQQRKNEFSSTDFFAIYTEQKPANYTRLVDSLEAFDPDLYTVFRGSFQSYVPQILDLMAGDPAICFLDPFGVVGISPFDMGELAKRADTEFMLTFNSGILRRMAGFEDSLALDAREKIRRVSEILGYDTSDLAPEWIGVYRGMSTREWEDWAVEKYKENLLRLSPDLRFACSYPVRETYKSRPKYHFIFASRAHHGIVPLNDICAAEEDQLFRDAQSVKRGMPGQMSMFSFIDASENDQLEDEVVKRIVDELNVSPELSRDDLVLRLCYNKFGEHKRKVYNQAIRLMIESGSVIKGNGPVSTAPLRLA